MSFKVQDLRAYFTFKIYINGHNKLNDWKKILNVK